MDTVTLRNMRPARMPLGQIKNLKGKPVSLAPHGQLGYEEVVPSFVQNHPDVLKLIKAGWLVVGPGPGDGDTLGEVTEKVPPDSPLKSAEALGVPPGDGPVVPVDSEVNEQIYLGDPSNPLPPDMNTGADHVEPHVEGLDPSHSDHQRTRRKKHE